MSGNAGAVWRLTGKLLIRGRFFVNAEGSSMTDLGGETLRVESYFMTDVGSICILLY